MSVSDDIKKLLSGSVQDRLEVIEKGVRERLSAILGVVEVVPLSLEFIVREVTLKRFNRIGQEGMTSYSQEGLSMAFPESDFDEYAKEIEAWKQSQEDEDNKRIGRFRLY